MMEVFQKYCVYISQIGRCHSMQHADVACIFIMPLAVLTLFGLKLEMFFERKRSFYHDLMERVHLNIIPACLTNNSGTLVGE